MTATYVGESTIVLECGLCRLDRLIESVFPTGVPSYEVSALSLWGDELSRLSVLYWCLPPSNRCICHLSPVSGTRLQKGTSLYAIPSILTLSFLGHGGRIPRL